MKRPRRTLDDRIVYGQWAVHAVRNTIKAYEAHERRCKSRVTEIIQAGHCYFITATIDEVHYGLSTEHLLKQLKRALNRMSATQYLINTDWGTKNGRLHFHVIASFPNTLILYQKNGTNYTYLPPYTYGLVHCEIISQGTDDEAKSLSKYVTKVYNHAHKQKAGVIIYSRRRNTTQ